MITVNNEQILNIIVTYFSDFSGGEKSNKKRKFERKLCSFNGFQKNVSKNVITKVT